MKLKNKKTGEIGEVGYLATSDGTIIVGNINDPDELYEYNSLAELNEEWEDYEEPKEYWYISPVGKVYLANDTLKGTKESKEIGNYFETKEEAEKAVKKLKAWKRLKDKGFRLNHWKEAQLRPNMSCVAITGNIKVDEEAKTDLDLLFGGE